METKIVIVVEKLRTGAGKFVGYKALFESKPEMNVVTSFRNQSVYELIRDYGERVGIELRGGGA